MQRWGILGTSFISETVAAQIIANQDSQLQAVAGRTQQTLDQFAETFSIPDRYTDYQALIDDENVDIVYIGLPNHVHHQYLIKALAAGKHVLCEKSLSVDMQKTDQIMEAVKKSNQSVIEGLMYAHHPFTKVLLALLENGRLGEVTHINAEYCVDIAQFVNPQGGGVVYDLGCYPLSTVHLIAHRLFGATVADDMVMTGRGKVDDAIGNVIEAHAQITFNDSLNATVKVAEHYDTQPLLEIETERAVVTLKSNLWMPENGENELTVVFKEGDEETIKIDSLGDAFYYQTEQFIELVEAQKSANDSSLPYPTLQDSYSLMQWLTQWEALCENNALAD